ncbi:MAG: TetR/AcrR family transcriptional regulator [Actinomycetota bacterium]|nr:TetR/AcrR family transcriptional regulator [Actinomycetota bacterium]
MVDSALLSLRKYPGPRPVSIREAQKQLTRERLIQTAIAVMVDRGFEAATIDEIASRANVGRTTVYKYFSGKPDIAAAIAETQQTQMMVAISAIKNIEPGSHADLCAWLEQFESTFAGQAQWMFLMPLTPDKVMHSLMEQDAAAEMILNEWALRGWVPAVAAPAQSLRLLFNLVGRWLTYHAVFAIPEPEHSREALLELLNCEITRIVHRVT